MPVETTVTRCGNCGATLQRTPGVESIRCNYCNQTTWLAPTAHATTATAAEPRPRRPRPTASAEPDDLLDRLETGPLRESVGRARRLGTHEAPLADPAVAERSIWPSGAEASSTFGGSWSPSTLLGPPRVYPRCGDIPGAWAPAPQVSPAEWVEVRFAADVPVVALRVYETNRAGSTYAIVDTTHGEQLLYAGPVESRDGAAVLEVALDAPRVVRSLRVFVANRGWTELDAVALVAASPLPLELRAPLAKTTSAMSVGGALAAVGLVAVALAAGVVFLATRSSGGGAARAVHALPPVTSSLAGAAFTYTQATPAILAARGVRWAAGVTEFSSQYSTGRNAAGDVVGPPDVLPRSGDVDGAWASLETDAGYEWVTVRFAAPTSAVAVVWAETFNPGAVVRVDDVTDPAAPVALWQGEAAPVSQPADVAQVTLAAPRPIAAVRLVLDTRRVPGWNEVDAIGLIPAAP